MAFALVACAAALLLAPRATAEPAARLGPPTLKGDLESGGTVAFELKRTRSGERRILRWRWRNLPVTCLDRDHKVDGIFYPPWPPVKSRAFQQRATLDEPDRKGFAEVDGRFPRSLLWRKAKGTFRVSGDTSDYDDCESGTVDWTAKRV